MDNRISRKNYTLIASMLFGLFFGAGNLIFPIIMGAKAGANVVPALIGMLVTAVGIPLLGIIAMGASFQWEKARQSAGPALVSTFIKLFGLCALFLPLGVHLWFRNDLLVAALVMCGSSTTISCFVMAKGMGHKGDLTISTVMLTTLLSAFSLTFWLFILKSHGWI